MSSTARTDDDAHAGAVLVSVVVPTFNRLERLRRVLTALADQTLAPDTFEIVVVSDGSTDGTDDYLRDGPHPTELIPVTQPNAGPAAARNRGVERASGQLVVFIDDDVIAAPDLIATHLAAHAARADDLSRSDTVVIGPMLTPPDHEMSPWVAWEQTMLYKQYDAMNAGVYEATARQFYTGNASLSRDRFVESGGFDESFRRAEDIELAFRLADTGLRFAFEPAARSFHYADRSFDSWCDIASQYGRNDVAFARQPNRDWLGEFMVWAYRQHHPVVRACTRAGIASPVVARVLQASQRGVVRLEQRIGRQLATRAALSILYSLRYHRSVADAIGGSARFREMLRVGGIPPAPTAD